MSASEALGDERGGAVGSWASLKCDGAQNVTVLTARAQKLRVLKCAVVASEDAKRGW